MPNATNRLWLLGLGSVLVISGAFLLRSCREKAAPVAVAPEGGAPDAAHAPLASNEANVARYKDETAILPPAGVVQWAAENVRTEAGGRGDLIVTVRRGTEVQKIAGREGYQLIVFSNPGDPSDKLMGWINAEAFGPEPTHAPPAITCTGEQVAILVAGGGEACVPAVTECKGDSDCSSGWVCDGQARRFKGGKPDRLIQFCRVGVRLPGYEAGAPPQADAGAAKHK
jgi:hypothetical protein